MNTLTKLTFAGLLAAVLSTTTAMAATEEKAKNSASSTGPATTGTSADAAARTDGEVKKVDKATGKLTIKHGELKNLGMPPMTMVFKVKDASILESVKAGDKVSFVADKVNGQFTVVELEPMK